MPRSGDEKIALMHKEYGALTGITCRTCPHLDAYCNADCTRVWYKCKLFGVSASTATDWRCGNTACGGFTIRPGDAKRKGLYGKVYRQVKGKRDRSPAEQIRGQVEMDLQEGT